MKRARISSTWLILGSLALTATGCNLVPDLPSLTGPSEPVEPPSALLLGTWVSDQAAALPGDCGNLQWQVTELVGLTATGTFSASCAGGIELQGTASGTLNGSELDWTATGTATGPGGQTCDFTLTGTAVPDVETIDITYSGTTCLGPVSGSDVLSRQ